jgi:hypothetical protein
MGLLTSLHFSTQYKMGTKICQPKKEEIGYRKFPTIKSMKNKICIIELPLMQHKHWRIENGEYQLSFPKTQSTKKCNCIMCHHLKLLIFLWCFNNRPHSSQMFRVLLFFFIVSMELPNCWTGVSGPKIGLLYCWNLWEKNALSLSSWHRSEWSWAKLGF